MHPRLAALKRIELYCTTHLVTAIPKIKLTRKQYREWDEKSYNQQMQYLEEHPDSIFQKVGITKKSTRGKSKKNLEQQQENKEGQSDNAENKETGGDENSDGAKAPAENADSGSNNEGDSESAGDGKTDESGKGAAESEPSTDGDTTKPDSAPTENKTDSPDADAKDGQNKQENPTSEQEQNTNVKGADAASDDNGNTESQLSTKHIEPDDATKQSAENNIKEIEEEGASAPNSKQREGVAATIENSGKKVAEELDDEDVSAVEDYEEEKENIKKGLFSPKTKKILAIMGMVALAGVAGVALFHVNPIIALYMGQMIGDNFGRIADAFKGNDDDDRSHASAEDGISSMLKDVAEYMRAGELPDDFVEAAKLSVGIDHEQK